MPDVSIAISAKDNFTEALRKMMSGTEAFHKDLGDLQTDLNRLNGTKASLKVDLADARRELQTARKEFERLGDAASRTKFEAAQSKFDNLQSNLRLVSRGAQQAERDMQSLTGTVSKTQNRFGGATSSTTGGAIPTGVDLGGDSLLKRLAAAGLGKMVGDTLSAVGGAYIGSTFGSRGGNLVSSALTGAGTGAAIGSVIPVIGTGVGAAIGGALGAMQGAAQNFENRDSYFKSYVQEQVEKQDKQRQSDLAAGSALAAQRQTDQIAFSTLFGNKEIASGYLEQVRDLANRTPFLYDDLTSMSKTLKTFGFDVKKMIPTLTAIGDSGAALGMGTGDMNVVATALGRMRNTTTVTRETMDMLRDRGIDAYGYLAKAQGVSKGTLDTMISKGKISGADASQIILDAIQHAFGGSMVLQSKTFSGTASTLEGVRQEAQAATGDGYNTVRTAGMQEQIALLDGPYGDALKKANREMGAFQASMDNLKEIMPDKMKAVVMGVGAMDTTWSAAARENLESMRNEYAKITGEDQAAINERSKIIARVGILAQSEYNASEGVQIMQNSQLALIDAVRADSGINERYWSFGAEKAEAFSKGFASVATQKLIRDVKAGWAENKKTVGATAAVNRGDAFSYASYTSDGLSPGLQMPKHAFGLQRVPRDDFPTLLHAGERVLTAQQARQQDAQPGGVQVHVHGLSVREEADVDKVAAAIVTKLSTARAARRP